MPNILISPISGMIEFNTGQAGSFAWDSTLSGVRLEHSNGQFEITSYNLSNSTRFSVDGNNGRLFTINDVSTGVLFSVNTVSGYPVFQVYNTGIIVSGNAIFNTGDVNVYNGNIYINGNQVLIGSSINGLINSGSADLRYLSTGSSGAFYASLNPNNFSTSGNVENTGTNLQGQINILNNVPKVTGLSIAGAIPRVTGDVILTSSSNIIIGQSSNGFTFTATIPPGFSTSGNLEATGTALQNQISNQPFTKSTIFFHQTGIENRQFNFPIWRAPFSCQITGIHGLRISGGGATINARKNFINSHLITDLSLVFTGNWISSGTIQNSSYVAGDILEGRILNTSGSPISVSIQIDYIKS